MSILSKLIPASWQEGLKRAIAAKVTRWVAGMAAGATLKWLLALLAHYGLPPDSQLTDIAKEVAGAVFTLVAGGGALAYSILDAKTVDAKITVAAAAGVTQGERIANAQAQGEQVQHDADEARAYAVTTAIAVADQAAPKTKDALLAQLAGGQ